MGVPRPAGDRTRSCWWWWWPRARGRKRGDSRKQLFLFLFSFLFLFPFFLVVGGARVLAPRGRRGGDPPGPLPAVPRRARRGAALAAAHGHGEDHAEDAARRATGRGEAVTLFSSQIFFSKNPFRKFFLLLLLFFFFLSLARHGLCPLLRRARRAPLLRGRRCRARSGRVGRRHQAPDRRQGERARGRERWMHCRAPRSIAWHTRALFPSSPPAFVLPFLDVLFLMGAME